MSSVRKHSRTGKLFLDFRYSGVRCREDTALPDSPSNRKKLKSFSTAGRSTAPRLWTCSSLSAATTRSCAATCAEPSAFPHRASCSISIRRLPWQQSRLVRTTLKSILERFQRKPYGWYYAAILCNLALLCARAKVEVRADGNLLEDTELERALLNAHGTGNVVIEPQVEFTASQVRALEVFYEDFFDAAPSASEAKALGKEAASRMQAMRRFGRAGRSDPELPVPATAETSIGAARRHPRQALHLVPHRAHPRSRRPAGSEKV